MTCKWFALTKAEYLVLTSSLRPRRALWMSLLLVFGIFWAIFLAPLLVGTMFDSALSLTMVRALLLVMFPGLMRTVMLFLFMLMLLMPLSYSLQEIKIGQWEIFFSNNVCTRDILIGTFLGKVPVYGLIVLFVAPPLLAVFLLAFEVSLIGQGLIYGTLLLMVVTTLWLSNFVTAMIQAKLGDSPRGNDIAKGLAMLIALVIIGPMYGLMFFAPQLSSLLGLNVFLVFPFTWPADVISWLAITFNGLNLTGVQIAAFQSILQFDLMTSGLLLITFSGACLGIGLISADRIFTFRMGARTETITTIQGENFLLRSIRRAVPGAFGSLLVTSMKDFFRKAQNLSRIAYGLILALIMPFLLSTIATIDDVDTNIAMLALVTGVGMILIGSITFAGTGFLESKDQLWIIQSAPHGASRYVKARLALAFLVLLPLTFIPVLLTAVLNQLPFIVSCGLLIYSYAIGCGAAMFATGLTALNPHFEDTKSPEHIMNLMISMMTPQFLMMSPFLLILLGAATEVPINRILVSLFGWFGEASTWAITAAIPLLVVSGLMVLLGTRWLGQPEY
ncbi:MAG: hypothetical protein ACFFCO_04270 [Promethearchaeota archaeon]